MKTTRLITLAMIFSSTAAWADDGICRLYADNGSKFLGQFFNDSYGKTQAQSAEESKEKVSRPFGNEEDLYTKFRQQNSMEGLVNSAKKSPGDGYNVSLVSGGTVGNTIESYSLSGSFCKTLVDKYPFQKSKKLQGEIVYFINPIRSSASSSDPGKVYSASLATPPKQGVNPTSGSPDTSMDAAAEAGNLLK